MTKAVAKDISKVKMLICLNSDKTIFEVKLATSEKQKKRPLTDLQKDMIRKAKEADKFRIV
ncbi:MAG: hypothetical protein M3044_22800 [Thermoproteota archaeon]|nr:hypothetical protein [Thermoproteota archaeon]